MTLLWAAKKNAITEIARQWSAGKSIKNFQCILNTKQQLKRNVKQHIRAENIAML